MARRRAKRGFGSTRRLPSRNYQARYTGPAGQQVVAPRTFQTLADAEAWLADERRRLEDPSTWLPPKERLEQERRAAADRKAQTFKSYAETWLATRRNSRGQPLRPTTRDKYESSLRNHVYPHFGETPIDQIHRSEVRSWHASLDAGDVAKAHAYATFRTIMGSAVDDDELIPQNPVQIRGAGARSGRRHLTPATLDELAVMAAAMPPQRRMLVLLAAWCGLRSGELRELRVRDVDFGQQNEMPEQAVAWLNVRRGVVHARSRTADSAGATTAIIGPPKTEAGVRRVSVPPLIVADLRKHLQEHAGPGENGLLFPADRDPTCNLSESTLNGRAAKVAADGTVLTVGFGWREARRQAGREDLAFHDLRHTSASMAAEAGASIAESMDRLGHSTPGMALRYQHSTAVRDQALSQRMSEAGERHTAWQSEQTPEFSEHDGIRHGDGGSTSANGALGRGRAQSPI